MKHLKSMKIEQYSIAWTSVILQIGCKAFTHEQWRNFSDDEIEKMDTNAIHFWQNGNNLFLQRLICLHVSRLSTRVMLMHKLLNVKEYESIYCESHTNGTWLACPLSYADINSLDVFKTVDQDSFKYKLNFVGLYEDIAEMQNVHISYDVDIYENQLLGARVLYKPEARHDLILAFKRNIIEH